DSAGHGACEESDPRLLPSARTERARRMHLRARAEKRLPEEATARAEADGRAFQSRTRWSDAGPSTSRAVAQEGSLSAVHCRALSHGPRYRDTARQHHRRSDRIARTLPNSSAALVLQRLGCRHSLQLRLDQKRAWLGTRSFTANSRFESSSQCTTQGGLQGSGGYAYQSQDG